MENTGEVMTASVATNIAVDPVADVFESGIEMDARITSYSEQNTNPAIEAGVEVAYPAYFDALGEESIFFDDETSMEDGEDSLTDNASYDDAAKELEDAREELRNIEEDEKVNENEAEANENFREQLETLNTTIRLLELQRDALRDQLGSTLSSVIGKVIKLLIVNPSINESEERGAETVDGPTEAWKDSAKSQLRNLEKKIFELKMQRGQLVANHMG